MAGHWVTKEEVGSNTPFGTKYQPGAWVPDAAYASTEGGAQAYGAYLKQAGVANVQTLDQNLTRAGQLFQQKFNDLMGRAPTSDEVSNFYKDAVAGSPATLNDQNLFRPVLENYLNDQYGKEAQASQQKSIDTKAQGQQSQVSDLIKSTLGRDATSAEVDHFSKLMASGNADTYTLQQALKQLPEYQNKQDAANREQLRGQLSAADQTYFQQNLMPQIQQQFAQQGRVAGPESQTLANAFASAGQQQNTAREQYLAQLGSSDYGAARANMINQYMTQQGQAYQNQQINNARNFQLQDESYNRANDITDYQLQGQAYQDYLRRMGVRRYSGLGSAIGSGVGMVAGGIIGAYAGGGVASVPGALAGASAGASGGRAIGGLFDSY